ncbi:hypothetical protein [Streptococcus sobrinus]|uniref:Amino acid transporter n=1 Tax=Streptococcus sobrinus TaxID=1310 RepID=A0ABN5LN22_9STRE|nr:hypothetical protein [Streptococcus sobrinus]AWN21442.1 amino acid transporter [Streptococcus sobrinus]RKV75566.1 MAG: amino acid transporter [Streptococcus sp.]SQG14256.1 lipoprotein [Streptococcus sobrinus]
MKRAFKVLLAVLSVAAIFTLAACGHKHTKEGLSTDLKSSYTGITKGIGYTSSVFNDDSGKDTLKFDTKKHTITNSSGESIYFKVITEKDFSKVENFTNIQKVFNKHKSELKGKDYFLIKTDTFKKDLRNDADAAEVYCIVLTNGGEKMHMFQLEADTQDEWFDFNGTAN